MNVLGKKVDLVAVDSQNNAQAQASLPATVGYKWRVVGMIACYTGADVTTPQRAVLAINAVNVGIPVATNDSLTEFLSHGIDGADGAAVTLTLPAGGLGALGDVTLLGIKIPTLPVGIDV